MASRLFQAVVGFGISMGVASLPGCGGDVAPAAASDASLAADSASIDTAIAPDTEAVDTALVDTGHVHDTAPAEDTFAPDTFVADSGTDVPADAFCDSAWPTTKGSPGTAPACIDPTGACAEAGPPIECGKFIGTYNCDHTRYAGMCSSGAWVCTGDLRPITECKCFGVPPPGYECTATGLHRIEDAATDSAGGD